MNERYVKKFAKKLREKKLHIPNNFRLEFAEMIREVVEEGRPFPMDWETFLKLAAIKHIIHEEEK